MSNRVPEDPQLEQLHTFRATHPANHHVHDGTDWEFIQGGSGPETLLILPGLLGNAEMAFQQILALEKDFRVIVPSYPIQAETVAGLVDGVVAILDAQGVVKFHVLGGSYGGMLAQRLVRRYPERVEKLVLSHTGVPEPERARRNRRLVSILRFFPMGMLRNMLRQSTRRSLQDAPQVIPFWEAYTDEILAGLSKGDLLTRYRVAGDFDATSVFSPHDLQDWRGQILILEGDNDPLAEAADRQALKALYPQAKVHTFQGTGHVASIAKVDEFAAVVEKFLRGEL